MTVQLSTSGTTGTLVIGTETSLATITQAGVYQLVVDAANMTAADELEIRIYGKPTAIGDTERQMYMHAIWNAQDNALKSTVPVISPISFRATIKQTAGTGRTFKWAIYQI